MTCRARIAKGRNLSVLLLAMAIGAGAAPESQAAEPIDLEGPVYDGEGHNVIAPFKNNTVAFLRKASPRSIRADRDHMESYDRDRL